LKARVNCEEAVKTRHRRKILSTRRFFMIATKKGKRMAQVRRSEEITQVLLLRLFRRGLLAAQLPRFLKDVLNVIEDSGTLPASVVNQRLTRLGWGEGILDERTLELILYLYEGRSSAVPLEVFQTPLDGQEIRAF
jgi:hypothetical protein